MPPHPLSPEVSNRHEEFVAELTAAHEKLLGYLMSLLGRWHDAEDVLQRTASSPTRNSSLPESAGAKQTSAS